MAAISSNADGKWITDAATVWVGGVAPGEGDTATILSGHDVEIDGNITVGADTTTAAIQVNNGGRLFVPSTVAGSYTLTAKGDIKTDGTGGTIEFGTALNPIPSNRTFTVKLNYSASLSDGEFGFIIAAGGTFTCQGADRWLSGLTDPDRCLLAADAAVNATSITVDGSTGWNADDYIAIAPTGTTYSQYEIGQVASVSGTTINLKSFGGVGGGLAYAHTGTDTDVQAEIINLTRNVVIMNYDGVIGTPGAVAYVSFATTATVDVDWTEFRYLGENAVDKYGMVINTTSGSCNLNRCSLHHFEDGGIDAGSGTTLNNFTVQNIVGYLLSNSLTRGGIYVADLTNSSWTINNCWLIGCSTPQSGYIYMLSLLGTVSSLRSAGSNGNGYFLSGSGNITGIVSHSNQQYGSEIRLRIGTITNLIIWHNNNSGIIFNTASMVTLESPQLYGNTYENIGYAGNGGDRLVINNLKSSGTSARSTTQAIKIGNPATNFKLNSPNFSYVAGSRTQHTYDLYFQYLYNSSNSYLLNNPIFNSTSSSIYFSNVTEYVNVRITAYNQTAGDHRTYISSTTLGNTGSIIQTDATYYRTAAPSVKMTSKSATIKLESGVKKFPIRSGQTASISVYFRKSASYNGNQPRMVLKRNDALGITSDTVLVTSTASNDVDTPPGTFTLLTGTTPTVTANGVFEVFVDCDGTAGYINLDDWNLNKS
jgi:hypothetical protein